MRIAFVSDVHGNAQLYGEITRLLRDQRPDLLILGGDIFPDGDDSDPAGSQAEFVRDLFRQRLAEWRSALPSLQTAIIPGNHDWLTTRAALAELDGRGELALFDGVTWSVGGFGFLGCGHTPPTPWHVKDFERLDRPDDTVQPGPAAWWDEAAGQVQRGEALEYFRNRETLAERLANLPLPPGRWFFVCHAPPQHTALDRLPDIPFPVGSQAVREFIERTRPLCALHGHIHESPHLTGRYTERVGATLCINPGQAADRLHAVWFEAADPLATLRHTVFR